MTSSPPLAAIYDRAFFAEWGSTNTPYVETARYLSGVLFRILAPHRLVDIGSGCGVYADAFRTLGVDVVSVDGVQPPAEYAFPGPVEIRDLTAHFPNVWGAFDTALCLEVGEHIPEEHCGTFLDNLTQFADTIALSCAAPGQRGTHHVNEQPKRYWIAKLAERGFRYDRKRTGLISLAFHADRPPLGWMCQGVSLFVR